jgi:hypothetical protein
MAGMLRQEAGGVNAGPGGGEGRPASHASGSEAASAIGWH